MRRVGLVVVMVAGLGAREAAAHQDEDPEAHRSMPNQVFASVGLSAAHHSGELRWGESVTSLGGDGAGFGVTIGFARELGRHFDLRLRLTYHKPLPDEELLLEGLHELHATIAPELLGYAFGDTFTFTLGPEMGLYVAGLSVGAPIRPRDAFESGVGFSLAMTAGVRTWVTYHTGFFAEVSAGSAKLSSDTMDLGAGWLGRVSVGWADRF